MENNPNVWNHQPAIFLPGEILSKLPILPSFPIDPAMGSRAARSGSPSFQTSAALQRRSSVSGLRHRDRNGPMVNNWHILYI